MYSDVDELGPRERPWSVAAGRGIPQAMVDLVVVVPFNDLDVLERALVEHAGQVAGMIMEPLMMNAGIVPPLPGYLEGVRELTRRHGVLLAFDEVKTGLTVGPGGATRCSACSPTSCAWPRPWAAACPAAPSAARPRSWRPSPTARYEQVGTFNGNPLTMAAARATLTEVLVPSAYERFESSAGACSTAR